MAMRTMEGLVTLAQESRFQLVDDRGVAHLFILSHGASAEASHLAELQRRQLRVKVRYESATNLIANVAKRVDLCG